MKITDIIKSREALGKYLRRKRENLNVSKSRLVRYTGLKYDTIKAIETGATDYTITSIMRYWIGLKHIRAQRKTKQNEKI